jgi:3-phosphoshikimate 1-carboxyvinyltransferase
VQITGKKYPPAAEVDCGESGLCLRMFAAIAALSSRPISLLASGSLRQRPVGMVEDALRLFGVECRSQNGYPPLFVRGPLQGGRAVIEGKASSQHLTGLLLTLPVTASDSHLEVIGLESKPYIRMTLATMRRFKIRAEANAALNSFFIPGGQHYEATEYECAGCWSAAAFMLVAGAIGGKVRVRGLDLRSPQADRAVVDVLRHCGALVTEDEESITVARAELRAFSFSAGDCPDLVPSLAVLAACCTGTSQISGCQRLRHKESDRKQALVSELGRLGVRIAVSGDTLLITGGLIEGGAVATHNDHRMAMAMAIAGLVSRSGVTLDDHACVAKSYPAFFQDLGMLRRK